MNVDELPTIVDGEHLHNTVRIAASIYGDNYSIYGDNSFGGSFATLHDHAVAFYPASNSDGNDVVLSASAVPAQFYKLTFTADGVEYNLSTGSGTDMADLAVTLAKAIAEGMVVVDTVPTS